MRVQRCAAGPWTRQLVARAGHDLPTTILRNAMALFLRPPAYARPHPVIIDTQRRFYARPDGALSLTGSVDDPQGIRHEVEKSIRQRAV